MNNVHEKKSHEDYKKYRVPDPNLSPRGFEQATLLGRFIADNVASALLGIQPIDELWVSPIKRTMQTMLPTAESTDTGPFVKLELFEAGGIYQSNEDYTRFEPRGGLTRSEMRAQFPTYVLPETVGASGWYPPAGTVTDDKESTAECRRRCERVAADLRAQAGSLTRSKNVVLVAHYDFLCGLLDALMQPAGGKGGSNNGPFVNWRHYNTGVTVIDISPDGSVQISMLNAIPHLAGRPDLVSGFDM